MPMTIYVVEGATGEYAHYQEWPVMAYRKESAAHAHVVRASHRANELCAQRDNDYSDIPLGANTEDPNMHADYTGVRYRYYPVGLR